MPTGNIDVARSFPTDERQQDGSRRRSATTSFPTTLSDLTFRTTLDPAANANIYKALGALRRSTLSIPNRLLSVLQDADFIQALHDSLQRTCPLDTSVTSSSSPTSQQATAHCNGSITGGTAMWPLIPNERSGSWPLSPEFKIESQRQYLSGSDKQPRSKPVSAYFKSTDGHVNQWSFSSRRLNLPVLELLGSAGVAVLIDTTRRGKAYPDALRRTVPIFTSVWNRTLFDDVKGTGVDTFQGFGLENGEISQIESRLPGFTQNLKALGLPLDKLRKKVKHPVRCLWVAQPESRKDWDTVFEDLAEQIKSERKKWSGVGGVNILICCSASRRVSGAEMSDKGYIQGAGDDSEGWSQGLTARLFWTHKDELVKSMEAGEDVESLVESLVKRDKETRATGTSVLVSPTENLYLGTGTQDTKSFDLIIDCNTAPTEGTPQVLGLNCKEGKLGSKMLRDALPTAEKTVRQALAKSSKARILVRCSTGRDLSVGVILVVLSRFYDDSGTVLLEHDQLIDKQLVKQRLAWITSSKPDANPSRTTLQAVNSVLIDRPK